MEKAISHFRLRYGRCLNFFPKFQMFSLLYGYWQYYFEKPNVNILMIGLDHAGKTTTLEAIKTAFGKVHGLPPEKIPPTVGMNLAKISFGGSQVIIWDLGGQLKMRSMWEKYYDAANAVIFIVDSADIGRLEEAKLAYDAACDNDSLNETPVLIIANKQDVPGALTCEDLSLNFFPIQDASQRRRIFPVSAITRQGLEEAVRAAVGLASEHARSK